MRRVELKGRGGELVVQRVSLPCRAHLIDGGADIGELGVEQR